MTEIYKLDPYADNLVAIVSKVNEVIDALNELTKPKSYAAADNLSAQGKEAFVSYKNMSRNLQSLLDEWNVNFYDDLPRQIESPVYCRNCQFRSQTLLDRMMLSPRSLCEGCAYKSAHG